MVHGVPAAVLALLALGPLQEREVSHPQELPRAVGALGDEPGLTRHVQAEVA